MCLCVSCAPGRGGRASVCVFGTLKDHCLDLRAGGLSVERYVDTRRVQRSKRANEQRYGRRRRRRGGGEVGEREGEGKGDEGLRSIDPTRTAKKGSDGDGDWKREEDTEVKRKKKTE